MLNFESGQDGLEEGMCGYAGAGAYPFFALGLEREGEREGESERRLDGDVSADVSAKNGDGNGDVSGNGDGNQMAKLRQRQHVRHISSATTLIVAREEEGEGDQVQVQVPEKVLIIGKGGDGNERGEKDDDDGELGLKRNATGLSMGGLEVLVRDEDIEFDGGGLERFGDGNGDGNGNGIEEGGEMIGKVLRWDEVVNIHSHLIGAILFALLPIYIYHTLLPRYHDATTADLVVFALFFGGVAVCFGLSFFHQTAAFWIELDYLGIVALMWGSTVATIYHGFICNVKLQRIYWSMITLLSLALTLFTLLPPFRTPFFRPYRTLMYAALGLSAIIFIVHSIIIYGISLQYKRLSLGWIVGMAGLNFVGALAYSLRIPEKYFPGRFDLYGNSHQILHCMVVLAALAHFAGLVQSFDYLHSGIEECPVR
ncbi:hypothetical protein BTUL_0004g00550 [Botrytis tulipae]|uniref:Uncharacterized protein n=1 Tax=Botrytis tulipae TaxID=87230 RepID=A0A4Z1F7J2_9HELO|nr:hypothetical protein BTUL_0004g00550 [Botrytis tulipae]